MGFDPAGFTNNPNPIKNINALKWYREAEITHGNAPAPAPALTSATQSPFRSPLSPIPPLPPAPRPRGHARHRGLLLPRHLPLARRR